MNKMTAIALALFLIIGLAVAAVLGHVYHNTSAAAIVAMVVVVGFTYWPLRR